MSLDLTIRHDSGEEDGGECREQQAKEYGGGSVDDEHQGQRRGRHNGRAGDQQPEQSIELAALFRQHPHGPPRFLMSAGQPYA
jgi:hypothetical protein